MIDMYISLFIVLVQYGALWGLTKFLTGSDYLAWVSCFIWFIFAGALSWAMRRK